MATLTIRNLPDDVRDRLRLRAARNGRSMEAEAREALVQQYNLHPATERPSAAERAERARTRIAPYLTSGKSIVDELLAERREAAARGE